MPLYEYSCTKCNEHFELMRSFNDTSQVKCPKCEATAKKMVSTNSFQLKGTGWYKTDYQNKSTCGCCANKGGCEQ